MAGRASSQLILYPLSAIVILGKQARWRKWREERCGGEEELWWSPFGLWSSHQHQNWISPINEVALPVFNEPLFLELKELIIISHTNYQPLFVLNTTISWSYCGTESKTPLLIWTKATKQVEPKDFFTVPFLIESLFFLQNVTWSKLSKGKDQNQAVWTGGRPGKLQKVKKFSGADVIRGLEKDNHDAERVWLSLRHVKLPCNYGCNFRLPS